MDTFVFLDTNVFLHYQDFNQIKWSDILGINAITIVIPPVTVRELNRQKDSNQYPKNIKTRAGNILIKLDAYFTSESKTIINEGLEILFEDRDPLIDFPANNLSYEINDDHLIASIIMLRKENPDSLFILVTSDSGLTLMAKARRHGIKTVKLGNNYKLKEAPDPDKEKIKDLQQELEKVKHTIPDLLLVFEDYKQHEDFTVKPPTVITEEGIEAKVCEIKTKYPKLPEKPKDTAGKRTASSVELSASLSEVIRRQISPISSEDITKYNADLDQYFGKYPDYLRRQTDFENTRRRTICLDILLSNKGTAPGEDIDIFMHFPDGFRLLGKLPPPPREVEPPDPPKSYMENILSGKVMLPREDHFLYSRLPDPPQPPSNVSSPNIKRTNSYEVNVHVENMKHGLMEQLDPLYIIFDSYDSACSFEIDYRILAANVPQEIKGKLHVVIQK